MSTHSQAHLTNLHLHLCPLSFSFPKKAAIEHHRPQNTIPQLYKGNLLFQVRHRQEMLLSSKSLKKLFHRVIIEERGAPAIATVSFFTKGLAFLMWLVFFSLKIEILFIEIPWFKSWKWPEIEWLWSKSHGLVQQQAKLLETKHHSRWKTGARIVQIIQKQLKDVDFLDQGMRVLVLEEEGMLQEARHKLVGHQYKGLNQSDVSPTLLFREN